MSLRCYPDIREVVHLDFDHEPDLILQHILEVVSTFHTNLAQASSSFPMDSTFDLRVEKPLD